MCAKFCYGMTVTLNPYNVVSTRCAAEYLEMIEDAERGNLIFKIEVFLNSSVLRSWKDTIIVLQTCKSLLPWAENLKVVARCIDSIASKTSVDPSKVTWSYTYNRKSATSEKIIENVMKFPKKLDSIPMDWWVEDICELDIDLYKRVMITVKSKGRMDGSVIGEALKTYAVRWLPDSIESLASEAYKKGNKSLVETIICLLPTDKGISCSCSFLLKLLKVAILVGADNSSREDLIESISLKLDEASVSDLLIPTRSPQTTIYDVELVQSLVDRFVTHWKRNMDSNTGDKNKMKENDFVLGHGSWLNVGKVVDGYLAEIARDINLSVSSFIELSQSIPESARPIHDGIYGAIDVYLKEHPNLTKAERKKLCGLMDIKKLTTDATMHAVQNEKLPLRVVVQVLFFEQVKSAAGIQSVNNSTDADALDASRNTEENLAEIVPEPRKSLRKQMDDMKIKEDELQKNGKLTKTGSKSRDPVQLLPSRSRKIFDKLWIVGKGHGNGEIKSSDTSGSSQSPTSLIQGETKSTSRQRRYSIS
ncbi:BTB POZ domain-containing NPY1 [Olea europaea subsp. europaea]|nr:BTB POZ domain-containing NPY1 [Olea europaea subsp. europaea]